MIDDSINKRKFRYALYTDCRVLLADSEDSLQLSLYNLN